MHMFGNNKICSANQLTRFYILATLAFNELIPRFVLQEILDK